MKNLEQQADFATGGRKAVAMVQERRYDLVLMDRKMPELDGLEATRMIRTEVAADRQPWIVAMTASVTAEDRRLCLNAGMDEFLSKPVRRQALVAVLDRAAAKQPVG